jgi:GxxExxY protein
MKHIYTMALEHELRARGHRVSRELGVMVIYKGADLAYQRLDLVVDEKVVVEVKSTLKLHESAPGKYSTT